MPTMICVQCGLFMKMKKNGVPFEEGMPISDSPTGWGPYKLWMADLYKCQGCGTEIIAGAGQEPLAEHYEENYERAREKYPPRVVVNDCPGSYHDPNLSPVDIARAGEF